MNEIMFWLGLIIIFLFVIFCIAIGETHIKHMEQRHAKGDWLFPRVDNKKENKND